MIFGMSFYCDEDLYVCLRRGKLLLLRTIREVGAHVFQGSGLMVRFRVRRKMLWKESFWNGAAFLIVSRAYSVAQEFSSTLRNISQNEAYSLLP